MRKCFLTEYKVVSPVNPDGTTFSSFILASNEDTAKMYATIRRLGEVFTSASSDNTKSAFKPLVEQLREAIDCFIVIGPTEPGRTKPTNYNYEERIHRLFHLVLFLLHIGETSGRYKKTGFFSDLGLVHQLLHLVTLGPNELANHLPTIEEQLAELQAATPEMF
jgi:hypothetical protein